MNKDAHAGLPSTRFGYAAATTDSIAREQASGQAYVVRLVEEHFFELLHVVGKLCRRYC